MKKRDATGAANNERETRPVQLAMKKRGATERKMGVRRKGRWPYVEMVLHAADRERRTLQAEEGGCELRGSGEGAARRARCGGGGGGGCEEKNVAAGKKALSLYKDITHLNVFCSRYSSIQARSISVGECSEV